MKSHQPSKTLPTSTTRSAIFVPRSQLEPANCAMTDSEPLSEPQPSVTTEHGKCEKCAATIRIDTGICVSCLLREGLEGGDEVSKASYQSVLAEVEAPQKSWFLGNYEILEQIGCGGGGGIFPARHQTSPPTPAAKSSLPYAPPSPQPPP